MTSVPPDNHKPSDKGGASTQKTLRLRRAMTSLSVLVLLLALVFAGATATVWKRADKPSATSPGAEPVTEKMKAGKVTLQRAKATSALLEQTQATLPKYQELLASLSPEVAATVSAGELRDATTLAGDLGRASWPEMISVTQVGLELEAGAAAVIQKGQEYTALLEQIASIASGRPVAVVALDAQTGQPLVQVNPNEVFTAASTIKIGTAVSMLRALDEGQRSWDSPLGDNTFKGCLELMIIESDNDCPGYWYDLVGLDGVAEEFRSVGSTGTSMNPGDLRTTAMDLALLLQAIETGQVLTDDSKESLLELMGRQNYRDGIPAGLGPETVVQDKVGFLDGYLHDAGIVRSEKGDYVLVVLTQYQSWDAIAQISAAVYDYL